MKDHSIFSSIYNYQLEHVYLNVSYTNNKIVMLTITWIKVAKWNIFSLVENKIFYTVSYEYHYWE